MSLKRNKAPKMSKAPKISKALKPEQQEKHSKSILNFIKLIGKSLLWFFSKLTGFLRNTKIQARLIAVFLLLSIVPLTATGYFSFKQSSKAIESKIETYSSEMMNLVNRNIRLEVEKHEGYVLEITTAPAIQQFLENTAEKAIEDSWIYDNWITSMAELDEVDKTRLTTSFTNFDEEIITATKEIVDAKFMSGIYTQASLFVTKKGYMIKEGTAGFTEDNVNNLINIANENNGSIFWSFIENSEN